ncbi:helix-turn-helix transcriptional regulator [Numidum massiliense]|uniref:helix-turn-helix transcriptional regulator n=1 Tax=Numidum massiliense TaxID=1522315 RepID=UPI0006D59F55|nr:transcriptional regulator [Numidum massiliense]
MSRLIRFLRIIYAIQGNPGIKADELADRCETTKRTIYRDLQELSLFVPITNVGYGKGYTFIGRFAMHPIKWTDQEELAFSLLPSIIDRSKLPPGFNTAYDKVMAAHTKERNDQRDLLEDVAGIIQMGEPAYRVAHANYLSPIIQAILEEKTIDCAYYTQSRGQLTQRKIDPYYLVPREQRFYVIGYCHQAKSERTFRLSRFRDVKLTDEGFDKSKFNIKQYLKNTWSIERGDREIRFKVRFSPKIAPYIKEEEMFVRPWMRDLPDGGLLFEVTLNHDREFLNWVYQYGPEAEILAPVAYRQQMKEQLAEWQELYA